MFTVFTVFTSRLMRAPDHCARALPARKEPGRTRQVAPITQRRDASAASGVVAAPNRDVYVGTRAPDDAHARGRLAPVAYGAACELDSISNDLALV